MEWRCSNGLFNLGFPGFWPSCINWVCDCIDRQRLEMEEKVVLGIVVNKIIKLPTSPIHCESSTIKQRNP